MELQEKLNILRKQHKLTQMELAHELEVSRQAISKWEQGTAFPSTENLIRLAELYGVSVEVLTNPKLPLDGAEQQTPAEAEGGLPQRRSARTQEEQGGGSPPPSPLALYWEACLWVWLRFPGARKPQRKRHP